MHRPYLLAAALAATFLAGCAPMDSKDANTAADEDSKVRVTGSRIPVRDSSASVLSSSNRDAVGGVMPTPAANINPVSK